MLRDALECGRIDLGTTVVESSSGNMGIGLAQGCRYLGLRLIAVVDARAHSSSVRTMRALGADVRVVTQPDPETGDLLVARLDAVRRLLAEIPNSFWPDQYANESNPAAHATGTMREIDEALAGDLDYLFVATSTTGTLRGCGDYLREHGRATRLVAVDSTGSALFGGARGRRVVPGFGAGVETGALGGCRLRRADPGLRPRLRRRLPATGRAGGDPRRRIVGRRRVRARDRRSADGAGQPLCRHLP